MAKKITIRGFIGYDENATPAFLQRELTAANGEEIDLEFSSGGGLVFAGLEMANMVRNYSGRIVARVTGLAASMSSYIPMMADEMIVEDNAVFMVHNVSTFAWGDFRDLAKASKHIEGLRDILAKAYVAKTGKSLAEIQVLMDDESFFYGDEIVEAGFADSVIQVSDDGDDKDTAVILAKEEINNIIGKMKNDEQAVKDDWQKAAASYFKTEKTATQPPASAGQPEKVEAKMDLTALLAANPEAKAQYDANIKAHGDTQFAAGETAGITKGKEEGKAEGKAEGKSEVEAVYAVTMPIISSQHYPEAVKTRVMEKAQAGDIEAVKDYVSMYDMSAEGIKTAQAIKDQAEETPATGQVSDAEKTEADFQARMGGAK